MLGPVLPDVIRCSEDRLIPVSSRILSNAAVSEWLGNFAAIDSLRFATIVSRTFRAACETIFLLAGMRKDGNGSF